MNPSDPNYQMMQGQVPAGYQAYDANGQPITPEQYQQQMAQAQQAQAAQMQAANPQMGQMPQVTEVAQTGVGQVPVAANQTMQIPNEQGYQAMPQGAQSQPYTTQPQMIMPEQTPAQGQNSQASAGQAQAGQVGQAGVNPQGIGSAAMQATPASAQQKDNPTSTQATLLISELRDNVVIMKDGSFRAVVACKSINFDLMSEVEREGVEYAYQNFLNSLDFTTQILIRSQRVDIGPYIERLSEIRRNNDNMLLGVLMDDYINFIDVLSQEANIMDKSFFIVVPYYSSPEAEKDLQQTKNFFKTFTNSKGPEITRINRETYDKALSELTNRIDTVISGLFQIGINSVRLNTKELAELYYNFNNPDTAVREPLVDFSKVATMYVKKGDNKEKLPNV